MDSLDTARLMIQDVRTHCPEGHSDSILDIAHTAEAACRPLVSVAYAINWSVSLLSYLPLAQEWLFVNALPCCRWLSASQSAQLQASKRAFRIPDDGLPIHITVSAGEQLAGEHRTSAPDGCILCFTSKATTKKVTDILRLVLAANTPRSWRISIEFK